MRRNLTALACLTLTALGLLAAMVAAPARAYNPTLADLPALGFTLSVAPFDPDNPTCVNYLASGNGADSVLLGDPVGLHGCWTHDMLENRIADLIARYPQPATVSTPAVTTTAAPADTAPVAAPAVPDPQTTTVTVTVADPTLQTQIDALNAKIDALSHRVDAIAQANTASWTAFVDAIGAGASSIDAALAARSAGLNAIYGL